MPFGFRTILKKLIILYDLITCVKVCSKETNWYRWVSLNKIYTPTSLFHLKHHSTHSKFKIMIHLRIRLDIDYPLVFNLP